MYRAKKMLTKKQICKKILEMCKEEQEIRENFFKTGDKKGLKNVESIDKRNREDFKEIFKQTGYISTQEYGEEVHRAAFLIVQHMPKEELPFRKMYEKFMKKDLKNIKPHRYAMIVDRNRTYAGKPQLYGTQSIIMEGKEKTCKVMKIYKIEDLDIRRKKIGLGIMQEEIDKIKVEKGFTLIM